MNRTIKAIMRHMVPPSVRSGSTKAPAQTPATAPLRQKSERKVRVVFAALPLNPSHNA